MYGGIKIKDDNVSECLTGFVGQKDCIEKIMKNNDQPIPIFLEQNVSSDQEVTN